jgi:hypothetical protein
LRCRALPTTISTNPDRPGSGQNPDPESFRDVTGSRPAQRSRPPFWFFAAVAVAFGFGFWLLVQAYTSPAVKTCSDLYQEARTAADSARVDRTTPEGGADPHSCGFIRQSARWPIAVSH